MEFGKPQKAERWPSGLIQILAFVAGFSYFGLQSLKHGHDYIHPHFGMFLEAFFGGLFAAIAAGIVCYFQNRNL